MPVHTGYDSNKKEEPKCYARWGSTGKKYFYTCNDESARDKAKDKAAAQGRAIIASGWQEKVKIKEEGGSPVDMGKERDKKDSLEKKQEQIRESLYKVYPDYWVICTFEDAIIANDGKGILTYEIAYSRDLDGNVTFGTPKEVTEIYLEKRLSSEPFVFNDIEKMKDTIKNIESIIDVWKERAKKAFEGAELTGPIVLKDDVQKIVFAAVLIPGEPDYDFDKGEKILTKEEVERVAHKWMEDYGNIDYMHGLNNVAVPIETYLLPMDWEVEAYGEKMKLPQGSWIMGAKVKKEEVWKKIDSGELTGFSIMGIKETALKQLAEATKKGKEISYDELIASFKKTLIKDLGEHWLVPVVSIVDEACVPKSKFFCIKSKEEEVVKKGVIEKIMDIFNGTEKKGRVISENTFGDLKKAFESLGKLIKKAEGEREVKIKKDKEGDIEMKDEEVKELVEKTVEEQLKPISDKLDLIKESLGKEEEDKKGGEEDKAEKEKEEKLAKAKEEKDKKEKEEKEKKDISNEELVKSLTERVDNMEKLVKKGKSNALKGDDNLGDEYDSKKALEEDGRDAMGRSKKKRF